MSEIENEIQCLAIKHEYDYISIFIAPDKLVSKEMVMEDVLSILKSMETGEGVETWFEV